MIPLISVGLLAFDTKRPGNLVRLAVGMVAPLNKIHPRDSLRLLKEKDLLQQAKLAALREAVQKGIDSGEATPLNMDEVIAEARQQQKS